jgi:hypothetical protein
MVLNYQGEIESQAAGRIPAALPKTSVSFGGEVSTDRGNSKYA